MKKCGVVAVLFCVLISVCSCDYHLLNNDLKLPSAISETCYWDDTGVQDFIDYCEYLYEKEDIEAFNQMKEFKTVETETISIINKYIYNFSNRIQEREYYESFLTISSNLVQEGDLYYLMLKNICENDPMSFQRYTLYYLDVDECKLIFINVKI